MYKFSTPSSELKQKIVQLVESPDSLPRTCAPGNYPGSCYKTPGVGGTDPRVCRAEAFPAYLTLYEVKQ